MKPQARTVYVIENPEDPTEFLLDLGLEICEELGWQPGDEIEWSDNGDGTWTIKKAGSKKYSMD